MTPRWVLQYFGTEVMRGQMYDAIWVDSCIGRYKGQNTVIADTRFPNEVKQIREHGGKIILVKRGQDPEWFKVMSKEIYNQLEYIHPNTHGHEKNLTL